VDSITEIFGRPVECKYICHSSVARDRYTHLLSYLCN